MNQTGQWLPCGGREGEEPRMAPSLGPEQPAGCSCHSLRLRRRDVALTESCVDVKCGQMSQEWCDELDGVRESVSEEMLAFPWYLQPGD